MRRIATGTLTACAVFSAFTWAQAGKSETSETITATIASEPLSEEEKEGIIFERQQIMMQLDADTKTLGGIVAGSLPATKLAETTRAISENAKASVEAFQPVIPGGRSKPEVWSGHEAFMQDMTKFASNAELMAEAGERGDVHSVVNLMIDALPCKQCHDQYRNPKTN